MTLPSERTRAVIEMARAVEALASLLHGSSEKVLVPRAELKQLHRLLKHYPTHYDMTRAAERTPELWGMP